MITIGSGVAKRLCPHHVDVVAGCRWCDLFGQIARCDRELAAIAAAGESGVGALLGYLDWSAERLEIEANAARVGHTL